MKLRTTAAIALVVALAAPLVAQTVATLSQSTNNTTITAGTSTVCSTGTASSPPWTSLDNGYIRSYSLAALTGSIDIVSIRFGVEQCNGTIPILIRLFADPNGGTPTPYSSLVLRHTEGYYMPPIGVPQIVTVPLTGATTTFSHTETLVVEIFSPAASSGAHFIIGANTLGQTAAGYLRAVSCGAPDPLPLSSLGFPTMDMIIDVNYVAAGTGVPYRGTNEDVTMWTAVGSNPLTTGVGNFVKTAAQGNTVLVTVQSTAGTFNYREFALIAQAFTTGFPPAPVAGPGIWMTYPGLAFLIGGDASPFGPVLLPPNGITTAFVVPPGLTGHSVIFQGVILTWQAPFAANGIYASTNGHVFQL